MIILSCWSKKLIIFLNISAYVLYSCYTMKAAAIPACSTYYLVITGQKRILFYAFAQNQTGTKFEVILDVYFIGCSFFYFFSEEKVQKSFFLFSLQLQIEILSLSRSNSNQREIRKVSIQMSVLSQKSPICRRDSNGDQEIVIYPRTFLGLPAVLG